MKQREMPQVQPICGPTSECGDREVSLHRSTGLIYLRQKPSQFTSLTEFVVLARTKHLTGPVDPVHPAPVFSTTTDVRCGLGWRWGYVHSFDLKIRLLVYTALFIFVNAPPITQVLYTDYRGCIYCQMSVTNSLYSGN
jgi:hypothetical protein